MAFNSELGGESAASKYVCLFVSGNWHLVHMRDHGLCFLLHLWMCTPRATSIESLLTRKGVVEYACVVWSDLVVLA